MGLTSALLNGLFSASNIGLYLHIHTTSNPNGELRANISPVLSTIICKASVDSQLPVPSGSPAGSATVTFSQLSLSPISVAVTVVATGLTSALTGVHIHLLSSITDATGPVVFSVCATSLNSCPTGGTASSTVTVPSATWTAALGLTGPIFNSLFSASNIGWYASLQTSANINGELRANINVKGSMPCMMTQLASGRDVQALTCTLQLGGIPLAREVALPIFVSISGLDPVAAAMPLIGSAGPSMTPYLSVPLPIFDNLPIAPNSSLCSESATATMKLLSQSMSTVLRQTCAACGGASCPAITGLSTAHPGGGMVTITGRNFGTVLNQVVLNVDVSSRSATSVSTVCTEVNQIDPAQFTAVCSAPAGVGSNINATVTIAGASPLFAPFIFNYAMPPVVESVSSVAKEGGTITVTGRNFGQNATQSTTLSVVNGDTVVPCLQSRTVPNINQMEAFVCTMPSSVLLQAALNTVMDVVISVNSLSIRVPAAFSFVETPVVSSLTTAIRSDGSAIITVTGTGFGMIASNGSGKELALKLLAANVSCQNFVLVRVALDVSGNTISTVSCTLPPFINSATSYNILFAVRGLTVQPSLSAIFVSAISVSPGFPQESSRDVIITGKGFSSSSAQLVVTVSDASKYSASIMFTQPVVLVV